MSFQRSVGLASLLILLLTVGQARGQSKPRYQRSVENYEIPDVTLLSQDRVQVHFREVVNSDKPVMLDFIFGTCTTICPVLSAGFSNLQRKLEDDSRQVQLVSISIDPEHDTPEVMKKYLARYRAKPGWDFLTGSRGDIDAVMRAFDAFVPDKMSHQPLTFVKGPDDDQWIRIDGLISTRALMEEYQQLLGESDTDRKEP
jgi:protein SCO1/2